MAYPRVTGFEITALLGEGGMGSVYRATDADGREVALKVLQPALARDKEFLLRFKREAAALAAVRHPGVARFYESGVDGDSVWYSMELVEGESLSARIADGPLPVKDALAIAATVADALDEAHRSGVIHRDVKPSNVILSPGGAKLTDFGIARRLEGTRLTTSGRVMGSLPYMPPEQVRGEALGAASDIYALGALLFEMLTATLPFDGSDEETLATRILTEPAPLASRRRLGLPPALDLLLVRMLAKDPALRLPSAADAAARLREIADGRQPAAVKGERRETLLARCAAFASVVLYDWAPRCRIGDRCAEAAARTAIVLASAGGPTVARVEAARLRRSVRRARRELRTLERKRDERLKRADLMTRAAAAGLASDRQAPERHARELRDEAAIFETRIASVSRDLARDAERARTMEERARAGGR